MLRLLLTLLYIEINNVSMNNDVNFRTIRDSGSKNESNNDQRNCWERGILMGNNVIYKRPGIREPRAIMSVFSLTYLFRKLLQNWVFVAVCLLLYSIQ